MSSQLDKGFEVFVNWQTIVFCLGVYFLTYMIRVAVEALWKGAKASNLWTELGLHCGPIGTGMLIAYFATKFPWPMPIADVMSAKLFYGAICGGMSGFVYGRFRAWIGVAADSATPSVQKLAVKLGGKPSDPPPALPDAGKTEPAPAPDAAPDTPKTPDSKS
jgi:hypothetical protein